MDTKEYMTHHEDMGAIQISEDVVATIATTTTLEVDGVGGLMNANVGDFLGGKKLTAKGVRVELVEGALQVHLFIMIRYGSAVAEVVGEEHPVPVIRHGVNDCFGRSGAAQQVLDAYGVNAEGVVKAVRRALELKK